MMCTLLSDKERWAPPDNFIENSNRPGLVLTLQFWMLHDSKLSKWDSGQESQMKTQWIIAILWKCFQDSITTLKLFGCCNFFLEKGMAGVRCRGSLARCSLQTTVFALIWLHTCLPFFRPSFWRYPEGYPRTGSAVAGVINAPEGKSLQSTGFRLFLQEGTSVTQSRPLHLPSLPANTCTILP